MNQLATIRIFVVENDIHALQHCTGNFQLRRTQATVQRRQRRPTCLIDPAEYVVQFETAVELGGIALQAQGKRRGGARRVAGAGMRGFRRFRARASR